MKLTDLKNESILILGLGREGFSILNFLSSFFPNKKFGLADVRKKIDLPNSVDKTFFGDKYLESLEKYDVIVKSPGIPFLPEIKKAKKRGKIITSATQIFFDECRGKIIGITGTKGKSTTSSLIYEVLKAGGLDVYLMGNIGIPPLEFLEKGNKDSIFVYELSSFQLKELNNSPQIAVITNLYPEHLDHHGNFKNYKNAKANIVRFQKKADFLIYNSDNKDVEEIAKLSKAKNKFSFSSKQKINEVFDTSHLLGKFNLDNIAPAIIVGKKIFNIPDEKIRGAIKNFKPLPHRLEFVGEFKGIKFYNDSLSTIPQATLAALNALGKDVETLIAGGFDRGVDYSILGPAITKSKIKTLILFPTTGEKIWDAVCKVGPCEAKKFEVDKMKDAVDLAFKNTDKGKIVLLSPASTSFNLFKDYEDRGNQFKEYVLKLGSN